MIFDVARHKLFEAVATLVVLALAMAISGILLADGAAGHGGGAPLGVLVGNFQHAHNIIASIVGFVLTTHLTFGITRAAVRSHLYGANSFATMSIIPLALLLFATLGATLSNVVVALLVSEAVRRILYAFNSDRRQQAIFTALLALGVMPLMDSSLFVVVCALPLILVALRCSPRETIIGIVGIALPIFTYAYVVWCSGGEFIQSIAAFYERMLMPSHVDYGALLSIPHLTFGGLLVLLGIGSVALYLRERMSMTLATRYAWSFILSSILLLIASFVLLPSASVALLVVIVMAVSMVTPILLLRISTPVASIIYLLLLACVIIA